MRARIDLSIAQSVRCILEKGAIHSVQVIRIAEDSQPGEISFLLIVAKKEKELVLDDWPTDRATKLVANVCRLDANLAETHHSRVWLGSRADCARPTRCCVIVEQRRHETRCAALGDGVRHAAGGAAILSRVARSVNLKFLDRGLADRIADTRAATFFSEECLIVIAAVDRIVIQSVRKCRGS